MRNNYTSKIARAKGFRSGFENEVSEYLKAKGIAYEYESKNCVILYYKPVVKGHLVDPKRQVFLPTPKGLKICQLCTYTADFFIHTDNQVFLIETKGRFTPSDRSKHKLIKEQHPNVDIRFLFSSDGKFGKGTRYSEWCLKNNFQYAIIKKATQSRPGIYVPEDWLC